MPNSRRLAGSGTVASRVSSCLTLPLTPRGTLGKWTGYET